MERRDFLWTLGAAALVPSAAGAAQAARGATVLYDGRVITIRKGRPVRLSRFRGKKVLLVTWASW